MFDSTYSDLINLGLAASKTPDALRFFGFALRSAQSCDSTNLQKARHLHCLGLIRYRNRHFAAAKSLLEQSLAVYRNHCGQSSAESISVLKHYGHVCLALNLHDDANLIYAKARTLEQALSSSQRWDVVAALPKTELLSHLMF